MTPAGSRRDRAFAAAREHLRAVCAVRSGAPGSTARRTFVSALRVDRAGFGVRDACGSGASGRRALGRPRLASPVCALRRRAERRQVQTCSPRSGCCCFGVARPTGVGRSPRARDGGPRSVWARSLAGGDGSLGQATRATPARSGPARAAGVPSPRPSAPGAWSRSAAVAAFPSVDPAPSSAAPAGARRSGRACASEASGLVLLIEEPELFLPPQSQRYLHRLRVRGEPGCSTRPTRRRSSTSAGSTAGAGQWGRRRHDDRPSRALPAAASCALSELDAERSDCSRPRGCSSRAAPEDDAAVLFRALGTTPTGRHLDRRVRRQAEHPLFVRICRAARVPFVAVPTAMRRQAGSRSGERVSTPRSGAGPAGRVVLLIPTSRASPACAPNHKAWPSTRGRDFSRRRAGRSGPAPRRHVIERVVRRWRGAELLSRRQSRANGPNAAVSATSQGAASALGEAS